MISKNNVDKSLNLSGARPADSDRTALHLSILAAILFLPVGLHLPYFPVWLAARGLSDGEIATVIAAPMVMRVLATPIIAALADRLGIALVLSACAMTMLAGYCGLDVVEGFAAIFLGALVVALAMGAMLPLADALTLNEIRRVDALGQRSIAYGHIRVWTSVGVLTMMLLSGRIVGIFPGERIIFALTLVALAPVCVAVLAALKLKKAGPWRAPEGGRMTADAARLRLAIICIAAAALIQASHAEVYSFGTIHWRQAGLSSDFIGAAWAIGVASESLLFLLMARFFGAEKNAIGLLMIGGLGAALRWWAMSADPEPWRLIALQAMHGLSFGATTCGSVLLLGGLALPTHRARMQGWLSAASALSLAAATFASGRLTSLFGQKAYLGMAALACAGLALALAAGALKRRLPA
jgi:PPP family 3-phenylpropionic acid transporter